MTREEAIALLEDIIRTEWPDVSFGMSQRIVLFHDVGDRSDTIDNALAVREAVFNDAEGDIEEAAKRLKSTTWHSSYDGTILSSMIIYNAGSDRRNDPAWMAEWAHNVASYERALEWAEQYREDSNMDKEQITHSLGTIWGIAELLQALKSEYAKELKDAIAIIKKETIGE